MCEDQVLDEQEERIYPAVAVRMVGERRVLKAIKARRESIYVI